MCRGRRSTALLALVLLSACADRADVAPARKPSNGPDVFLIAGQSNSVPFTGMLSGEAFAGQTDLRSPWPAFAAAYGRPLYLVGAAFGGSGQHRSSSTDRGSWDEGGELFGVATATLDSALATLDAYNFRGVIWMQGERDARTIDEGRMTKAEYKTAFVRMIARFRARYGMTMPFYIIRIGAQSSGDTPGFKQVRDAQDEVALEDPYSFMVFTGTLSFVERGLMHDLLHYMKPGYDEMGRHSAQRISAILYH